jgi:hypothetical protein
MEPRRAQRKLLGAAPQCPSMWLATESTKGGFGERPCIGTVDEIPGNELVDQRRKPLDPSSGVTDSHGDRDGGWFRLVTGRGCCWHICHRVLLVAPSPASARPDFLLSGHWSGTPSSWRGLDVGQRAEVTAWLSTACTAGSSFRGMRPPTTTTDIGLSAPSAGEVDPDRPS